MNDPSNAAEAKRQCTCKPPEPSTFVSREMGAYVKERDAAVRAIQPFAKFAELAMTGRNDDERIVGICPLPNKPGVDYAVRVKDFRAALAASPATAGEQK